MHAATRGVAVDVEKVSRRFGHLAAVDGVSLQVAQGEFVSLLGPSGCGKTTLLRLIGGFETPDSGRIRILGEEVTHVPPHLRRTNMVFQHLALFPHLNVFDNIAFGLRMRRTPEGEVSKKVARALELVRLGEFGARRIDQLSGGQKQRIAIARAIVNEPSVLLLDEPLGALDLRLRLELQEELRRVQRTLGSPFIFVTHDQGEAMAMSDRIAVMNGGRIEQVGTAAEIYENPASLFVATFVGQANRIEGIVARVESSGQYLVQAGAFLIASKGAPNIQVGQAVVVLIRREAINLVSAPASGNRPALDATVIDRVFLGGTIRHTLQLNDGRILVAEGTTRPKLVEIGMGQRVAVSWPVGCAQAFAV